MNKNKAKVPPLTDSAVCDISQAVRDFCLRQAALVISNPAPSKGEEPSAEISHNRAEKLRSLISTAHMADQIFNFKDD